MTQLRKRLNVFPVHVPSLRERIDDIPLLTKYYIERYAATAGKKIRNIETRTLDLLQAYHWPANIRELQNVIERAVILCDAEMFSVERKLGAARRTRRASAPFALTSAVV